MPVGEGVQPAIGIFFQHEKVGGVELVPVVVEVSEEARTRFLIEEDKAAKIAIEGLNAGAKGNKVVVVAQVRELLLDKGFLKSKVRVEPGGSLPHIGIPATPFSWALR